MDNIYFTQETCAGFNPFAQAFIWEAIYNSNLSENMTTLTFAVYDHFNLSGFIQVRLLLLPFACW